MTKDTDSSRFSLRHRSQYLKLKLLLHLHFISIRNAMVKNRTSLTEAEKVASVAAIQYKQKIMEKESMQKISEIEGTFQNFCCLISFWGSNNRQR